MTKIGFIGLGTMGASFASNLIKAGFEVTVNDLHRQVAETHLAAGAAWADTPRKLAAASDVILTSLPGPAEIEAVLIDMPGVHDCAVFGIPNEEFGESLCAYVQPEAGRELTADQVRGWLQPKLADYKLPRTIEFASELPREDSGKIFKRRLRDPYWAEAGRSI